MGYGAKTGHAPGRATVFPVGSKTCAGEVAAGLLRRPAILPQSHEPVGAGPAKTFAAERLHAAVVANKAAAPNMPRLTAVDAGAPTGNAACGPGGRSCRSACGCRVSSRSRCAGGGEHIAEAVGVMHVRGDASPTAGMPRAPDVGAGNVGLSALSRRGRRPPTAAGPGTRGHGAIYPGAR
jgi:hypothetical protein